MGGIHPPEPIAQSVWGQSGASRYRPIEPQPPQPAPCTPQWVGAVGSHGAPWGMKSSAPLWGTTASAPVPQPHTSHPTASGELSAHTWGPAGRVGGACRRRTHPRAPTPLCLHNARAQCRLCVGILQGPNPCQEPEATPGVGRRVLGVGVELRPTGAPRADTQHTLSTAAFPPLRLPAPHLEPHQECGQLTHAGGAAPAAPPALIDRGPHGCPTRGAEGCRHCVAPGGGDASTAAVPHTRSHVSLRSGLPPAVLSSHTDVGPRLYCGDGGRKSCTDADPVWCRHCMGSITPRMHPICRAALCPYPGSGNRGWWGSDVQVGESVRG